MTDFELINKLRGLETYGYQSQLACQASDRLEEALQIIQALASFDGRNSIVHIRDMARQFIGKTA